MSLMKVMVTGGRHYADEEQLNAILDEVHSNTVIDLVMHGNASGADTLAKHWCRAHNVEHKPYPADWGKFGRAAGPMRNQFMVDDQPDVVIAFPGGKGTGDAVKRARKKSIIVIQVPDRENKS
jgi:YspA, cpYpsA-related SLOG family